MTLTSQGLHRNHLFLEVPAQSADIMDLLTSVLIMNLDSQIAGALDQSLQGRAPEQDETHQACLMFSRSVDSTIRGWTEFLYPKSALTMLMNTWM